MSQGLFAAVSEYAYLGILSGDLGLSHLVLPSGALGSGNDIRSCSGARTIELFDGLALLEHHVETWAHGPGPSQVEIPCRACEVVA